MDDVGTQILDAIYDQLKVEDEWALRLCIQGDCCARRRSALW